MGIGALKPAVFLDRDGVINRNVFYPDTGAWESPRTAAEFVLLPGVPEALTSLQRAGYLLFLVSNQPNAAKGKVSMPELLAIHARMETLLKAHGVYLTESFYCYHHPEGTDTTLSRACECRKPSPYFLLRAMELYSIDRNRAWMIGDRGTDVECGQRAGVRTIYLFSGESQPPPESAPSFPGLPQATAHILQSGDSAP